MVRLQVRSLGGGPLVFAPPKGGRERKVPLPRSVSEALAEHIRLFPPQEVTPPWKTPHGKPRTAHLIFTGPHGGAINRNHFNAHTWRPARRKAGIADSHENGMHTLRHYYASVLLQGGPEVRGVDIRRLSEYLGHHNPACTLRVYSHLMPDAEEQTLKAIDTALSPDGPEAAQEADEGK